MTNNPFFADLRKCLGIFSQNCLETTGIETGAAQFFCVADIGYNNNSVHSKLQLQLQQGLRDILSTLQLQSWQGAALQSHCQNRDKLRCNRLLLQLQLRRERSSVNLAKHYLKNNFFLGFSSLFLHVLITCKNNFFRLQ